MLCTKNEAVGEIRTPNNGIDSSLDILPRIAVHIYKASFKIDHLREFMPLSIFKAIGALRGTEVTYN